MDDTFQKTRGFHPVGPETVFAPLPPMKWVCEDLHLCPGRPAILAGNTHSGKTLAVQSLALSIATGRPIWDHFLPARQGTVLHIDYEQGEEVTCTRYHRLARGLGITPFEVGDWLDASVSPRLYLTDPDAESVLARSCKGIDLCIIDSLRAPGVDENDSKICTYLDILRRVSRRQGTTFLAIHNGSAQAGSAIFNACGCLLVVANAPGKPKRVYQARSVPEAEGSVIESFCLAIEDVEVDGDPRAGVRVVYKAVQGKGQGGAPSPAHLNDRFDYRAR